MDTDWKESAWYTARIPTFQTAGDWYKMSYIWNSTNQSANNCLGSCSILY